ncbi:MAG: RluA family pseudouridine synthase [Dongiaceae bacterium]
MSGKFHLIIPAKDEGMRLDRFLRALKSDLTQGQIQKLLRQGDIRINGKKVEANARLEAGQELKLPPFLRGENKEKPTVKMPDNLVKKIRSWVIYQDQDMIALNKPPGLAVQGGSKTGQHLDAWLDALADGKERPRLVHRLDKDTSGVLLLARNRKSAAYLTSAFRGREVEKIYWAVVVGVPAPLQGEINAPLAKRRDREGEKMAVAKDGDQALTLYRVLDQAGQKLALLELSPHTGRTHQLRAHCQYIGHPILGDPKYGGEDRFLKPAGLSDSLHLHARQIRLRGLNGKILTIKAELPEEMAKTLAYFNFTA